MAAATAHDRQDLLEHGGVWGEDLPSGHDRAHLDQDGLWGQSDEVDLSGGIAELEDDDRGT
ncbi:MAG: hypothetical protein ACYC1E_14780 [Propionibacteriaceae bacterium]